MNGPQVPGARRPPLRVGVIGAGNIATLAHIPGLLKTGDAAVVAICDPDESRASAAAERFGIAAVFDGHDRMLRGTTLDAVTVATPPVSHAPAVLAALDAGLHVLCEKPLATSVVDAERIVERADDNGLVLAMNLHFRALRESLALKAAIDDGRLGAIHYVHIRYLRNDFVPAPGSWARVRGISGGGSFTDMGSHLIDLALWLAGADAATSVDAHMHGFSAATPDPGSAPTAQVEDFASVRLRLDTGASATVECSWGFFGADERRIQVIGERGGAEVVVRRDGRSGGLVFYSTDVEGAVAGSIGTRSKPGAASGVSYGVATGAASARRTRRPATRNRRGRLWHPTVASFVAAIRGEGLPVATGRDGLAVQRILESAYRSDEAARPVP